MKINFTQQGFAVKGFCFSIILLPLILLVNEKSIAQSPNWLWAKAIGGKCYNGEYGYSTTVDALGNIYTTGFFCDTLDFDPGPGIFNIIPDLGKQIFISKLDASGNFVWAKVFQGMFGDREGHSIAVDQSGNVYTTGSFQNTLDFDPGPDSFNLTSSSVDIFISKLDSSGNFIWAKSMDVITGGISGLSIALDDSDNVYTTGPFAGNIDFNPDSTVTFFLTSTGFSNNMFISKSDSSGNFVWARSMGGTSNNDECQGNSIAVDASGNVYTTGSFDGTIDFDPGAGTDSLTEVGGGDIFVSKLDASGNFVWAKQMGGTQGGSSSGESGNSIAVDASGNVYTTGNFGGDAGDISDFDPGTGTHYLTVAGFSDIFISKLDSSGNFVWAKQIGDLSVDAGFAITLDVTGNVYIAGIFAWTVDFDPGAGTFNLPWVAGYDIFISKLNAAGNFIWAKAIGGTGNDYCTSVALDAFGDIIVAGYFRSPYLSIGSTVLNNADTTGGSNDYDIFIAKLDSLTSGIENIENSSIVSVYPNPVKDLLVISYPLLMNKKVSIVIADITGKIIYEANSTGMQRTEVNTNNFSEGIYFVQIKSEKFVETKKVVIVK